MRDRRREERFELVRRAPRLVTAGRQPRDQVRWWPWKNSSEEDCPAYGVVKTSGSDEDGYLLGTRPDAVLVPWYALNGPNPVAAGETGELTWDSPVYGRLLATIEEFSFCGPQPNSWDLVPGSLGFIAPGLKLNDEMALALNVGILQPFHCGYQAGDTVHFAGFQMPATVRMDTNGQSIPPGTLVLAMFDENTEVVVINAPCPPET